MATDASRNGKEYPVPVPVPSNSVSLRSTEHRNSSLVGVYVKACEALGVAGGSERVRARVGAEAKRLEGIYGRDVIEPALRELARRNATPAYLEAIAGDVDRAMHNVPTGRVFAGAMRENPIDAEGRRRQT